MVRVLDSHEPLIIRQTAENFSRSSDENSNLEASITKNICRNVFCFVRVIHLVFSDQWPATYSVSECQEIKKMRHLSNLIMN